MKLSAAGLGRLHASVGGRDDGDAVERWWPLSLCAGVRTAEARALRRSDPCGASADTQTKTSRRTLALPRLAVTARQTPHDDSGPGPADLVFCTATGQALDAANVYRLFRAACTTAGIGPATMPSTAASSGPS